MTVTISPETEAMLKVKAKRDGIDPDSAADALIREGLEWEEQDSAEMIARIRRGLEASDAGRAAVRASHFVTK